MIIIGDKDILAFEVGGEVDGSAELRYVNIWVAGQLVNEKDNIAIVPAIISAAIDETKKDWDLSRYQEYYEGLNEKQIHQYIVDSRVSNSSSKPEDYELFSVHEILNWGENTDEIFSFLIQVDAEIHITVQYLVNINDTDHEENIYHAKTDLIYCNQVFEELIKELQNEKL